MPIHKVETLLDSTPQQTTFITHIDGMLVGVTVMVLDKELKRTLRICHDQVKGAGQACITRAAQAFSLLVLKDHSKCSLEEPEAKAEWMVH
jgi:hypothetical protein